MKKKILIVIIVICIMAVNMPTVTRAAVVPYFIAVNDTLLPFNDDTMPYISGYDIFVPYWVFRGAGVWPVAAEDLEWIRLYRGPDTFVDFFVGRGEVRDKYDNNLSWPSARRIGSRFYVPLKQVCDFFDLTYTSLPISRDIIPQEQMSVIRIRSGGGVNDDSYVGLRRNAIRDAYNEYYSAPSPSPDPPVVSPGITSPPPPVEEPPPTYEDVTIYISFYDISAGGADALWELLDANAGFDYRFCFFVSVNDIYADPGLIRRISGSGHTIGIWLEEGTFDEYRKTSALLFEATKIKTVLVSASEETGDAMSAEDLRGLVFWQAARSIMYDDTLAVDEVTAIIPTDSGANRNLMSSCSVNSVLILSGILSHLREYGYSVSNITETVAPG